MQPIIYYFEKFWEFIIGDEFNFIEACKNGDAVTLLSFICATIMVWGFFLRPIYRLATFRSITGKKWWQK